MAIPVQFRGREDVVKAYDNLKVPRWAIFNGKTLNEKYEGDSMEEGALCLEQYLEMVERSNTSSIYTLKTYEDLAQGQEIKPSTECDRSFNFQVGEGGTPGYSSSMRRELDELKTKLAKYDDDAEGEEEKISGFEKTFQFILEMPGVKERIGIAIGSFLDKLLPMGTNINPQPAAMGAVPGEQDQLAKVQSALAILVEVDPNIGDNLLKIAQIAKQDKQKYFQLAAML